MSEFALIERLRRRVYARADVVLGIGDDGAVLQPRVGEQLVMTMDTLNEGVHFPADSAAADIGWKTLAVNLSDLAAMGAQPAWCTLSLSLPAAREDWLEQLADGLFALADLHDIALVGGDTTRGPLSLSLTAIGRVPAGTALRRDGARVGDDIWVTGTLGDAAAALALWQAGTLAVAEPASAALEPLRQRLQRPTPRLRAGCALRDLATAAIDVSDGLLADLAHVCRRSGVGAQLWRDLLPASAAARAQFAGEALAVLQCAGGDDYELCFTAPPPRRAALLQSLREAGVEATRIGRIEAGTGVRLLVAEGGADCTPPNGGYQHFG